MVPHPRHKAVAEYLRIAGVHAPSLRLAWMEGEAIPEEDYGPFEAQELRYHSKTGTLMVKHRHRIVHVYDATLYDVAPPG